MSIARPLLAWLVAIVFFTCAIAAGERATDDSKSIRLFNGKDLDGWTPVLAGDGANRDDVWNVRDGGVLWCLGKPKGYLRTKRDDFQNYELTLEWRWPAKPGNNGVLVHVTDPAVLDIWPRSHEIQLNNGHAGDIWVIGTTLEIPQPEGRIKGRRHINTIDDAEKPLGEWNKMRIVCAGDELTIYINDKQANYASKLSQTKGAIALQSEGAEIEYRNIVLKPLK
jgi:3-keto-disaccharide hydrolase